MTKFNMKDYENYMEEEKRQDRFQEELEDKRMEEFYDADENWRDWQREQEEKRRLEEFNRYPEPDVYLDEDDFFEDCYDDSEESYDDDFCYMFPNCNMCSFYPCHNFLGIQSSSEDAIDIYAERAGRKSVVRNRHLNKVKVRKSKAQKVLNVAKREMRKCSKLIRKLNREYDTLFNKLFSDNCSNPQDIAKQMYAIETQIKHIESSEFYFKSILEMSEYKQALSAPKAV